MNGFIATELQRIIEAIPKTDPTSTDYHILLQSLECFAGIAELIEEVQDQILSEGKIISVEFRAPQGGAHPDVEDKVKAEDHPLEPGSPFGVEAVKMSDFVARDIPKPEGYDEEFKDEAEWQAEAMANDQLYKEKSAKTYDMTEVRAALVEARKRGINVTALLREYGVENFGAFPAGKYGELMDRLADK